MKLVCISLNPIVGDFQGNLEKVFHWVEKAKAEKADLIVFPELALVGYPPQDLLTRPSFAKFAQAQLENLAKKFVAEDFAIVIGTALASPEGCNEPLINAAAFLHKGEIQIRAKSLIPHYGIFNERRYFESALDLDEKYRAPIEFQSKKIGILICEDSWHSQIKYDRPIYQVCPTQRLAEQKVDFLLNLSASPFTVNKQIDRLNLLKANADQFKLPTFYVNQCGANDEVIFDGANLAVDSAGNISKQKSFFRSNCLVMI